MKKNGQLKTQNVKVSLTGSLLYTKKVRRLSRSLMSTAILLYFTPPSPGAEARREQWYTPHDEDPQGGRNSSDSHRMLYSCTYVRLKRKEHLKDNQTFFHFILCNSPLLQLPILLSLSLFLQYRWKSTPQSSFFLLSHTLCVPPSLSLSLFLAHAGVKTTQLCDRSQSHSWPCSGSHTLCPPPPPQHECMCVFMQLISSTSPHIITFWIVFLSFFCSFGQHRHSCHRYLTFLTGCHPWLSSSAAVWLLIFPKNNPQHHLTESGKTLGERLTKCASSVLF